MGWYRRKDEGLRVDDLALPLVNHVMPLDFSSAIHENGHNDIYLIGWLWPGIKTYIGLCI